MTGLSRCCGAEAFPLTEVFSVAGWQVVATRRGW
ncbi:hypothetical protein Ae505Ps2_6289 [Pseudonocardia sp. Ae505_Ps2]|nr:hypothetical protein Ae505Ps2_6289 [Pseudonocardia sp. Ae505_Ps2]